MAMRRQGFMQVARQIVRESPGLSAPEVAKKALAREPSLSQARDPIGSLSATLFKQVKMGMERGIFAQGTRPIRYYRKDPDSSLPPSGNEVGPTLRAEQHSPVMMTFSAGDSQFRGPATKENIRLIKAWLEELEKRAIEPSSDKSSGGFRNALRVADS